MPAIYWQAVHCCGRERILEVDLAELEREFRDSWRGYDPTQYEHQLSRTSEEKRSELLARLLAIELEYAFQPPLLADAERTCAAGEEDDERVRPSVALFALRFTELLGKPDLMIRLIVLEYALRLQHDRLPPNPDSYLPFCQSDPERVINLLRLAESRLPRRKQLSGDESVRPSDSTVKDAKVSVSVTLDPLPCNLGCFLLVDMIGRGGMGFVHSAIDLRSTAQVAVKVMRRTDPWSVHRFIEEFTWLSHLSHPNLVKLYDAFSEGDLRYFSMELVEGKTIREWFQAYLQRGKEDLWEQLKRVLAQAASALDYMHQHGVIHCDIKCSNVMITRRRAVVLDLGLAVREGNAQPMVGTLQYMAPEVLDGAKATRASDWYSFGILLFETLTDSQPPVTVNPSAPSRVEKYVMDEAKLADKLEGCDPQLSDLCRRLLNVEADRRPDGKMVLEALGDGSGKKPTVLPTSSFVGRHDIHQQLTEVCSRAARRSRMAVVFGESGIGKTSAVQHWLEHRGPEDDELVLYVRCYRQDHTPLRLLNSLVRELVQKLQNLPASDWRTVLAAYVKEIGNAFPQLLQLLGGDAAVTTRPPLATPQYLLRSKGLQKLGEWLAELSHSRRLLLILDDVQWADDDSLRLLVELVSGESFRACIIAIDEDGPERLQQLISQALPIQAGLAPSAVLDTIELQPLSDSAATDILTAAALQHAIELPAGAIQSIVKRAGGIPFLLLELYRTYCHYAKRDGISDDHWLVADSRSSLLKRFSLLPIQAENVLQYLAVAGQPISFHQLQMVSRILPHELQRTVSLLTSQGWVRSDSQDVETDVVIAHENFRKIVLHSMPQDRLHRRHFRMARMLSSEVPPPWARMGDHYWASHRYREAVTCYIEAARAAFKSSAFKDAARFLDRVNLKDDERSPQEHEDLVRLKADCLAGNGNALEAAELYDSLSHTTIDGRKVPLYRCLAGEQWIRGGQVEAGVVRLTQVLDASRANWLRSTQRNLLGLRILSSTFDRKLRTPTVGTNQTPFSEMEQCLNRISIPLMFLHNRLGPELVLRMKKRVHRRGSDFDAALAVLHWGVLLSLAGNRLRKPAAQWLRKGRQIARKSARPAARGSAEMSMFVWYSRKGDFAKAVKYCTKAIDWFQREPHILQWETQLLYWGLANCHWHLGNLEGCRQAVAVQQKISEQRSDSVSLFFAHVGAAHFRKLAVGEIEQARRDLDRVALQLRDNSFHSPQFFIWISEITQRLYDGKPQEARVILMRDWHHLESNYDFRTPLYQWTALRTRLCLDLILVRENESGARHYLQDAERCLVRIQGLKEPIFATYARAFQLVLRATKSNQTSTQAEWQSVINELHRVGHRLMAHALVWHRSLSAPPDLQAEWHASAHRFFSQSGYRHLSKVMDFVLPLPANQCPTSRISDINCHSSLTSLEH